MDYVELTLIRKRILVYWWMYHKESLLWPTGRDACKELDIAQPTLLYHVNLLVDKGWMQKKGKQVALSHYGYEKMKESEEVALGKREPENLTKLVKKMKHIKEGGSPESFDIFWNE